MAYAKFKLKNGKRVRVNLDRILAISELEEGTEILLEGPITTIVAESFQTVSNQVAKNDKSPVESDEPQA